MLESFSFGGGDLHSKMQERESFACGPGISFSIPNLLQFIQFFKIRNVLGG